ncbi:MAG: MFS transporter [Nocardiopsaceae bacterium]|nr:MFS transporter [Nocardiopsaceae bacterium]
MSSVLLLFLGSTFIGVDLALPGIIMPDIQGTFGFGVFTAGLIGSITFIFDGFSAYLGGGHLADRIRDRKKVLVPSGIGFSILSWLTGAANGTGVLVLIRAVMGIPDGGWYGNAYPKATEDPPQRWRSGASGLHMASYSVGAGLLAPAIAPAIANSVGWRVCFLLLGIPSLLVALAGIWLFRPGITTSNIKHHSFFARGGDEADVGKRPLTDIFRYRNVTLCFFIQACMFATVTLFTSYGTLYLTHTGFSLVVAGGIIAGWGVGGIIGNLVLPVLSDFIGRKYMGALALFVGAVAVGLFISVHDTAFLFLCTGAVGFFVQGTSSIFLGLVPQETLPSSVRGTGTAFVHAGTVAIGGGAMALIAGVIGQVFGVTGAMEMGMVFCVVGVVLALFVKETAPRLVARRLSRELVTRET